MFLEKRMFSHLVSLIEKADDTLAAGTEGVDVHPPATPLAYPGDGQGAPDDSSQPPSSWVGPVVRDIRSDASLEDKTRDEATVVVVPPEGAGMSEQPPSLIAATTEGSRRAVPPEYWSERVAALMQATEASAGREQLLRLELADVRQLLSDRDQLLRKLSPWATTTDDPPLASTEVVAEVAAHCHQTAELPVRSLERAVSQQQEQIAVLRRDLTSLRTRELSLQESLDTERSLCLRRENELNALVEQQKRQLQEADVTRAEASKALAKYGLLRTERDLAVAAASSLKRDAENLQTELYRRGAEIVRLQSNLITPTELKSTAVYRMIEQSKWGSSAASAIDVLSLRAGRALLGNATIRLGLLIYVAVLHLYLLLVMWHVSHGMPASGVNVHDHVANHLHHT